MAKQKKKIEKEAKLNWLGAFVHWADQVEVRMEKKMIALILMIGAAGFVVNQQDNNWKFFGGNSVARAEGALPNLAPEKKIMSDSSLGSRGDKFERRKIIGDFSLGQFAIKKNIENLIADKPMQSMVEALAKRDIQTASYLVAIAKKESNLGKFSPKDAEGNECFNYWGYRGKENTTDSGYSCFDSPEHAVKVVGDRIQFLAQVNNFDTPKKMSVWKCGYDCSWDNPAAVEKWIRDVAYYYEKINGS